MNKLAGERSTYLLQHADNPVDWYPYGTEALERAQDEGKLIFMSIGYSSCHWCHVMARESFEDPETAEFLNRHFICIKVDREERPGLDKVYQELYQLMTHRPGGWPLSVWMTPDAKPIFIGTYFPRERKYNSPTFREVCEKVLSIWDEHRDQVLQQAESLSTGLPVLSERMLRLEGNLEDPLYTKTVNVLRQNFDRRNGGIGGAPKFPRFSTLRFLLAMGVRTASDELVDFVLHSFVRMVRGGIYDHLGGGMARYSVDKEWKVPHFEKMLYDNAGLLITGSELYAVTGNEEVRDALSMTVGWLEEEMLSPCGGFYASINAESEGREGKYYLWTEEEFDTLLGEKSGILKDFFGVTSRGNFRDPHHPEEGGNNVLSRDVDLDVLSSKWKISKEEMKEIISQGTEILYRHRRTRIPPEKDCKKICSWNAMTATGLLLYSQYCMDEKAEEIGIQVLDTLIDNLWDGVELGRYFTDGDGRGEVPAALDDYSFLIEALLTAYETTGKEDYIQLAEDIRSAADLTLYSEDDLIYYLIPEDSVDAINGRPIQITDDSMASALAVMVRNLFKLGKMTGREELESQGRRVLERSMGVANTYIGATNELLLSGLYYLEHPTELVYLGSGGMVREMLRHYLPTRIVYWGGSKLKADALKDREQVGEETIYVCRNMTCSLPITRESVGELAGLLKVQ